MPFHWIVDFLFKVQGKDPSVDFTQEPVEESEDERCFDDMNESVPPIELPPCELARLEEISGENIKYFQVLGWKRSVVLSTFGQLSWLLSSSSKFFQSTFTPKYRFCVYFNSRLLAYSSLIFWAFRLVRVKSIGRWNWTFMLMFQFSIRSRL